MRFLADMGISPSTAVWLTELGYDAVHLRDEGLHRLADSLILQKTAAEERILLTSDLDFGYLVAASGTTVPSVILFRLSDMRPRNVCTHLEIVLHRFQGELLAGSIIVVREGTIRVRRLPIGEGIDSPCLQGYSGQKMDKPNGQIMV